MIYLIELTDYKQTDIAYYPFIIWKLFGYKITDIISYIGCTYGKVKAVWECDSWQDAENWRKEILKMRGQEELI